MSPRLGHLEPRPSAPGRPPQEASQGRASWGPGLRASQREIIWMANRLEKGQSTQAVSTGCWGLRFRNVNP